MGVPTEYLCPEGGACTPPVCGALCRRLLLPPIGCLHFVGFKNERYWAAVRAFGLPDIIHRVWDARAKAEVGPDDVVVFASGDEHQPVNPHSWDDSHEDIVARGGARDR